MQDTGITFAEFGKINNFDMIGKLAYHGQKYQLDAKSEEEVESWLDEDLRNVQKVLSQFEHDLKGFTGDSGGNVKAPASQ